MLERDRRVSGPPAGEEMVGTATETRSDAPVVLAAERSRLVDRGFCVLPGLLPAELLARLRVVTDRLLDAYTDEQKQRSGGQGSIFAMEHGGRCTGSGLPGRATGAVT